MKLALVIHIRGAANNRHRAVQVHRERIALGASGVATPAAVVAPGNQQLADIVGELNATGVIAISVRVRCSRITVSAGTDHLVFDLIPVVIDVTVGGHTQQRKRVIATAFVVTLPHVDKVDTV